MRTLLEWVNEKGQEWPAVVSSAVLHFRFEYIHPFGDGNGRAGRALAAWELYRRKFDSQHLFAVDETLWQNRPRYYAALREAEKSQPQELTTWIAFMAEMIETTLEQTWKRLEGLGRVDGSKKIHLTPRQEKLLKVLRSGPMRPADLQKELELTKGGLHFLLKPLLRAGLVQRAGGYKTGVYRIPDRE
jgi:Fic family protein